MANYKFYDSRPESVSTISLCEIRWHADPAIGYGKFMKYSGRTKLSDYSSISSLEQLIKSAKSTSFLPPKHAAFTVNTLRETLPDGELS